MALHGNTSIAIIITMYQFLHWSDLMIYIFISQRVGGSSQPSQYRAIYQLSCQHSLIGKAGHQLDKRSISGISDAYFDTSWRGDISWYLMINTHLKTGSADIGDNRNTYATCGSRGECLKIHALSSPCCQSLRRVKLAVA